MKKESAHNVFGNPYREQRTAVERGGKWHIAGNCYDEKDRHSEQVVGACREVVEKSSEDEYH